MFNPRFPHRLYVLRAAVDEYGELIFDEDGNPQYERVILTKVEMLDGQPMLDANDQFITEEVDEIEFGYRTNTENTSTANDVIVAGFKIAIPMILTEIKAGDILVMTEYTKTYKGSVVKAATFNIGSNIWFDEVKN